MSKTEDWRKTNIGSWNEKTKNHLLEKLTKTEYSGRRIALFGQTGQGKSSFINSVYTAFTGERKTKAPIRHDAENSTTERVYPYEIKNKKGDWNVTIYDIQGISDSEEGDGVTVPIMRKIMTDGTWDENSEKSEPVERLYRRGYDGNMNIHSFILCVEYRTKFTEVQRDYFKTIQEMIEMFSKSGVPVFLMITKVDQANISKFDPKMVLSEKTFRNAVEDAGKQYKIAEEHVLLQSNYHGPDHITDLDTDIMTLYNLWFVLSNIA